MIVSAIVPNYNDGERLAASIEALQSQLSSHDEILIVDDGSTDQSRLIIERLAAADGRVRTVYHERNRGAIHALNSGLRQARGDYVVLASANDVVRPGFIRTMKEVLTRTPDAAFACGEVVLRDHSENFAGIRPAIRPSHWTRFFSPTMTSRLLRKADHIFLTGSSLIARSEIEKIGYLRPELGSFADGFALRCLALRKGFVFVPALVGEWRIGSESFSRRAVSNPLSAARLLEDASAAFRSDSIFPDWYGDAFRRRWKFAVIRFALQSGDSASPALTEFGPGGRSERTVLAKLARAGAVGKLCVLSWCAIRFHPVSFSGLLATRVFRSFR